MSTTTFSVLSVPAPAQPRGAVLVGLLLSAAQALFRSATPPASNRAQEAARVRELARQVQHSDPSFAADLLAAALRHESLDDEAASAAR